VTSFTSASSTSKFSAGAVPALPGPGWLRQSRLASWERFSASELPREAEEIWRYSRIEELELSGYALCPPGGDVAIDELPGELQALVGAAGPGATVLVSHNGGEGRILNPQDSLRVVPFGDAPLGAGTPPPPVLHGPAADVWTDLNGALVQVPWRVTVAPEAVVEGPLVIVHWLDRDGCAVFPRLEVEVGDNASVRVVEIIASADIDVLSVPVAHLYLRPGAKLSFGHVQLLGGRAWQLGNQVSRVGKDATLRSMTVALGGHYARERTDSVLEGPGGDSELLAAFFGAGDQMHDLRTVQHHAAPHTRSDLLFKGAVANKSHSVYSGLIRVEKGAKGTNAFQTNRNLVLSEGAQADSVPTLEIEDNDVRCSHASTVGPIDESQLFYLESRGVPTHAAERLIALGFMEDVLERFPVGEMVGWLRHGVASKLGSAGFEGPPGQGLRPGAV
jgi:Fe-S cluster assembly protein SufD